MLKSRRMSKPEQGMLAGLVAGVGVGIWGVFYFAVASLIDQLCVVSSSLLVFQLLGGTIAAAMGKPPHTRIKQQPNQQLAGQTRQPSGQDTEQQTDQHADQQTDPARQPKQDTP